MMKILMLGWELPPHNSGGLGVACLNLARALVREGTEIDFVVPYQQKSVGFMRTLSALKISSEEMNNLGSYDRLKTREKSTINYSMREVQKRYGEFVREYLGRNQVDMVHVHDWLTMEAGMIAKREFQIPLVVHIHATEFDRAGRSEGNPLICAIEAEGLNMADRIIAVSEGTRRVINNQYKIALGRIAVAYNALDEDFGKDSSGGQDLSYGHLKSLKKAGKIIVTTVGRFTAQKGLAHLMRAAAKAIEYEPRLIFVFAGDGEDKSQLIKIAAEEGIAEQVFFTGFVRGEELKDVYRLSDIFVMSSVSEPFGLTALEAAHHGSSLVLTKQSGVAEILRSAMTYDFWDEEKLANILVAIAKSKGLSRELNLRMAKEYRNLTWGKIAKKCQRIYNDIKRERSR